MAFADIVEQSCLCAWIQQLGEDPKNQLKLFIEAAKAIIQATKATWLLVNTDFEDILKKDAAEATLAVYETVVGPFRAPAQALASYSRAFADCPPVNSLSRAMKAISDELLGDIDTTEFEIQQYINAIQINQAKSQFFDQLIGICDDVLDAIDLCST
jgi:hypothetical protein